MALTPRCCLVVGIVEAPTLARLMPAALILAALLPTPGAPPLAALPREARLLGVPTPAEPMAAMTPPAPMPRIALPADPRRRLGFLLGTASAGCRRPLRPEGCAVPRSMEGRDASSSS